MSYLRYWSLRHKPFLSDPKQLFFAAPTQREAIAGVNYFVATGDPTARMMAARRCGMSWMMQHLSQMRGLGDCAVDTLLTDGSRIHPGRVAHQLAAAIGLSQGSRETRGTRETRLGIANVLRSNAEQGVRTLWLIDRCDSKVAKVVETLTREIPMLSVLIGIPTTSLPSTDLYSERFHIELQSLTLEETLQYLCYCLEHAGGDPELFTDGAGIRLHELTGGAIGDLAGIAEYALAEAAATEKDRVTTEVLESVVSVRQAA